MSNWNSLKKRVEKNANALTVPMQDLKEAEGAGRLGVHVRNRIKRKLAGLGLGHVPKDLPPNHHQQVRLYKRGTDVGDLIETALTPGRPNDKVLVEQVAGQASDYASIVQSIRELVAE